VKKKTDQQRSKEFVTTAGEGHTSMKSTIGHDFGLSFFFRCRRCPPISSDFGLFLTPSVLVCVRTCMSGLSVLVLFHPPPLSFFVPGSCPLRHFVLSVLINLGTTFFFIVSLPEHPSPSLLADHGLNKTASR